MCQKTHKLTFQLNSLTDFVHFFMFVLNQISVATTNGLKKGLCYKFITTFVKKRRTTHLSMVSLTGEWLAHFPEAQDKSMSKTQTIRESHRYMTFSIFGPKCSSMGVILLTQCYSYSVRYDAAV